MKLRLVQTISNESRKPIGLTPAHSDCETAALCLTLKMREKWNVKLSILYNKYDFVHFSSLKLGRCLVLCPGLNHYIELHLINLLNLVSLMEKDRKKCQMRRGLAESWSLYVTTCCFTPQAMQTMVQQELFVFFSPLYPLHGHSCVVCKIFQYELILDTTYFHFQLLFCQFSS